MFGSWWKKSPDGPFPPAWIAILEANVAHYRSLSADHQAKLRERVQAFIADKDWEGCGGLDLTDEIRVTIAAQACLLTLGLEEDGYHRVRTILVYPNAFVVPHYEHLGDGVYLEGESEHLGEAHYRGPVILSWAETLKGSREPGSTTNLVIHEFAHQLDMLDGAADGIPPMPDEKASRRWQAVMAREFDKLVDAAERGRATLLDHYGAKDEAEFFSVACECFFDRAVEMAERHKKLYTLLRDYFQQDPAAWGK